MVCGFAGFVCDRQKRQQDSQVWHRCDCRRRGRPASGGHQQSGRKIEHEGKAGRSPSADDGGDAGDVGLAVGTDVLHGTEGVRGHAPESKGNQRLPEHRLGEAFANQQCSKNDRVHKVAGRCDRVEKRLLFEAQAFDAVGQNGEQRKNQGKARPNAADHKQVNHKRQAAQRRSPNGQLVQALVEQGTLDATLARVAQIALVIKNVIDAIHQQVVGNQKEQRSDNQSEVDCVGEEHVGCRKRKRRVYP